MYHVWASYMLGFPDMGLSLLCTPYVCALKLFNRQMILCFLVLSRFQVGLLLRHTRYVKVGHPKGRAHVIRGGWWLAGELRGRAGAVRARARRSWGSFRGKAGVAWPRLG
jgi:hypothetical protein